MIYFVHTSDVAVGAPYEGDGAVYIFRGAAQGIVKEYSQRIYAGDLQTARPLTTFGYALSGGIDMDKSYYPDLAVGAFASDKVLVLRARPVIKILALLMSVPEKISPAQTKCLKNGQKPKCFEVKVCMKFTAEPKDQ